MIARGTGAGVERHLQKVWEHVRPRPNWLTVLAAVYGSDKGFRSRRDTGYTRVYEPLFEPVRLKPLRFLEIGLLGFRNRRSWVNMAERDQGRSVGTKAPSLAMWSWYFPNAQVIGFDINDFSAVTLPRVTIVRGDMGSREGLAQLVQYGPFDVIVEDGSHAWQHQQIALGFLFQHLAPGGLYCLEDLSAEPNKLTPLGTPCTRQILRCAMATGRYASPLFLPAEQDALNANAATVELYDAMGLSGKPHPSDALRHNDALAIIRRKG